jgi:crossover junction endodeoxyribonuclease RuvC
MNYVLGIDPSLTATGLAWIGDEESTLGAATLRSTGRKDDPPWVRGQRLDKIETGFEEILDELDGDVVLAVIEGASHGSTGGAAWDRAGLWWALVRALMRRGIPVAVCAPLTRIKWATGVGRATDSTKADVAVACLRLWPDALCKGDNEWDGLCLATIGAQRLAWPVPTLARHADAQRAIVWPELHRGIEPIALEAS